MRIVFYLWLFTLALGCSADRAPSDSTSEERSDKPTPTETNEISERQKGDIVEQLQGKWIIQEANLAGQPMDTMKGGIAEINGEEIIVEVGGARTVSTLVFHEGTEPLQFDSRSDAQQQAKAILQLTDGELVVSTSLTGDDYPQDFEPNASVMVIKYKRP